MGRAASTEAVDADAGASRSTAEHDAPTRRDMFGVGPGARVSPQMVLVMVLVGGGSGFGTNFLGGWLPGTAEADLRRELDDTATELDKLDVRLDKCDADIRDVAEDAHALQLWTASSMPLLASGIEQVAEAVGAKVKIRLPELPGRSRR